jgi:hypothetical protein
MADGNFGMSHVPNMVSCNGVQYCMVDPWIIVGMAAKCRLDLDAFEKAGLTQCAMQSDYMLGALETMAGMILHNDADYFTFGPGFEEYMDNTGQ